MTNLMNVGAWHYRSHRRCGFSPLVSLWWAARFTVWLALNK